MSNSHTNKPFTSYEEQLNLLVSKGLIINDRDYAIKILKKTSYFALINGYKELFKDPSTGKKRYKDEVLFDDIVSLYTFDCELRSWLLRYALVVERKLKSLISYHFSHKHKDIPSFYLEKGNYKYNNTNPKIDSAVTRLIANFKDSLESNKYRYINHYKKKHEGDVPLWVICNSLSFGKTSKLFELCLPSVQNSVCSEYKNIKPVEMVQMLLLLTKFRNVSAHNERLYDYIVRDSLKNMNIHVCMAIGKNKNGFHSHGLNDLFAALISFRCLLDDEDFAPCYEQISSIIDEFKFKSSVVTRTQVMQKMGFPHKWKNIKVAHNSLEKDSI